MRIFETTPQPGLPLALRGVASGLERMARAWETLTIKIIGNDLSEGAVRWENSQPILEIYIPSSLGALDVAGEPGPFKAITLRGWTMAEDGTGEIIAPDEEQPTELYAGEAGDFLRLTWDYIRALPEDEEE